MIRIGLIGPDVAGLLDHVLPAGSEGVWSGRHFSAFDPEERYDWIAVIKNWDHQTLEIVGDPENVAHLSMEPMERRLVRREYLEQFTRVVGTDPRLRHPGLVRGVGLEWWIGRSIDGPWSWITASNRLGFDELARMEVPQQKHRRVSVVTSSKSFLPGHVARDRLLAAIQRHPVARHVDVFGHDRRRIDDKWDAIAPNAYHLALENTLVPDYWTEKISDAYLGFALPLYFGCPNLHDYFPADSYIPLDAFRPRGAIETIERVLDEDVWAERLPAILEARRRVLDVHHPLSLIARVCDRPARRRVSFLLRSPGEFRVDAIPRTWWRAKRQVYIRTRGISLAGRPLWRVAP